MHRELVRASRSSESPFLFSGVTSRVSAHCCERDEIIRATERARTERPQKKTHQKSGPSKMSLVARLLARLRGRTLVGGDEHGNLYYKWVESVSKAAESLSSESSEGETTVWWWSGGPCAPPRARARRSSTPRPSRPSGRRGCGRRAPTLPAPRRPRERREEGEGAEPGRGDRPEEDCREWRWWRGQGGDGDGEASSFPLPAEGEEEEASSSSSPARSSQ